MRALPRLVLPATLALGVAFFLGCAGPGADSGGGLFGEPGDEPKEDADGDDDGLKNDEENELGTDPDEADSDGDGVDDGKEVDENTDPTDEDDKPYEGGWSIGDCRDSVEPSGWSEGDISNDFVMVDQFGQNVQLHAFCDKVVYLVFAAFW